jgi:hypothetical protein
MMIINGFFIIVELLKFQYPHDNIYINKTNLLLRFNYTWFIDIVIRQENQLLRVSVLAEDGRELINK